MSKDQIQKQLPSEKQVKEQMKRLKDADYARADASFHWLKKLHDLVMYLEKLP